MIRLINVSVVFVHLLLPIHFFGFMGNGLFLFFIISSDVYIEELGKGTFSTVVRAWDSVGDRGDVSIKITKKEAKYRDAAFLEVELLAYMKMHCDESSDHRSVFL